MKGETINSHSVAGQYTKDQARWPEPILPIVMTISGHLSTSWGPEGENCPWGHFGWFKNYSPTGWIQWNFRIAGLMKIWMEFFNWKKKKSHVWTICTDISGSVKLTNQADTTKQSLLKAPGADCNFSSVYNLWWVWGKFSGPSSLGFIG